MSAFGVHAAGGQMKTSPHPSRSSIKEGGGRPVFGGMAPRRGPHQGAFIEDRWGLSKERLRALAAGVECRWRRHYPNAEINVAFPPVVTCPVAVERRRLSPAERLVQITANHMEMVLLDIFHDPQSSEVVRDTLIVAPRLDVWLGPPAVPDADADGLYAADELWMLALDAWHEHGHGAPRQAPDPISEQLGTIRGLLRSIRGKNDTRELERALMIARDVTLAWGLMRDQARYLNKERVRFLLHVLGGRRALGTTEASRRKARPVHQSGTALCPAPDAPRKRGRPRTTGARDAFIVAAVNLLTRLPSPSPPERLPSWSRRDYAEQGRGLRAIRRYFQQLKHDMWLLGELERPPWGAISDRCGPLTAGMVTSMMAEMCTPAAVARERPRQAALEVVAEVLCEEGCLSRQSKARATGTVKKAYSRWLAETPAKDDPEALLRRLRAELESIINTRLGISRAYLDCPLPIPD